MKKIVSIAFALLCIINCALAQSTIFEGKIGYTQTLNLGDGDWDISYDLYFNNSMSFYQQSYNKHDREITITDDGSTHVQEFATEKTANYYLSYLNSTKILFGEQIAYVYYHVKDNVPEINWKLKNETKKIGGFNCKKAVGVFRGRNYTAWYTEEIPINAGPWKLKGLSGLILEVADDKGVYKAQAVSISLGKEYDLSKKILKILSHNRRVSIEKYVEKKQNEQKDILNYLNAKLDTGSPLYRIEDQNKRQFIELFK